MELTKKYRLTIINKILSLFIEFIVIELKYILIPREDKEIDRNLNTNKG